MNDFVYVMYNLQLKRKQNRKTISLPFDQIHFNDEWINKEEYKVELEHPQGEDDGGIDNAEFVGNVGGSSSDQTLNALDLDNLVLFEPDVDDAEECRSKYDMKF